MRACAADALLCTMPNSSSQKIGKLIALARRAGTVHEAAAGLDETADAPPTRTVERIGEVVIATMGRRCPWRLRIAIALCRASQCDLYSRRSHAGVEIVVYGQPTDTARVRSLYASIVAQCDDMARAALAAYHPTRDGGTRRTYARDYRVGYSDAIARQMDTARDALKAARKSAKGSRALARVDQAVAYIEAVDAALRSHRDSLGLSRGRGMRGASGRTSGYADGRRAGSAAKVTPHAALT